MSFKKLFNKYLIITCIVSAVLLISFLKQYEYAKNNYTKNLESHSKGQNEIKTGKIELIRTVPHLTADQQWDVLQNERRNRIRRNCKVLSNTSSSPTLDQLASKKRFHLSNIIVDDKHKALYCYIPKVVCTQWKRLMMVLTGLVDVKNIDKVPQSKVHYSSGLPLLLSPRFTTEDIHHRITTYKKFLIVRHPIERLLSAFRDKFLSNTTDAKSFKRIFAYNMMKTVRNTTNIPLTGEGMRFEEFLSYVTSLNIQSVQEHWSPYFHLCHPCAIEYDYIGKYETLETDSNQILKRIKAPGGVTFPPFTPSKTTKELDLYLRNVSSKLYNKVLKFYNPDFRLFGYNSQKSLTNP